MKEQLKMLCGSFLQGNHGHGFCRDSGSDAEFFIKVSRHEQKWDTNFQVLLGKYLAVLEKLIHCYRNMHVNGSGRKTVQESTLFFYNCQTTFKKLTH